MLINRNMKRYCLIILFLCSWYALDAQNLFVGTYNMRNENNNDYKAGNGWTKRLPHIAGIINFEKPDVFGTQELLTNQINTLLEQIPEYDYIGIAREDGKLKGEYSAIFYNRQTIELVDKGNFWLNQTPDMPVKGWDAACVRICSWGKFKEIKSGLVFYFFNLHLDHVGTKARKESSLLVVDKIKEIAKDNPVILTGDFNVDQNNEIYTIFTKQALLKDAYSVAKYKLADNGTFNSFDNQNTTPSRIDHVFLSSDFQVEAYAIMTNCYWDTTPPSDDKLFKGKDAPNEIGFKKSKLRTPSDHYPVLVKILYNSKN